MTYQYFLSQDEYIAHPPSPPVTLSLSPFLALYPPSPAQIPSTCSQPPSQRPGYLDIREKARKPQKLNLMNNGKSRTVHKVNNRKPQGPHVHVSDYYYADRTFDGSRAKVCPDQVNIIVNNFTLENPSRSSDIRLNTAAPVDSSHQNLQENPAPILPDPDHSSKEHVQKLNGHLYENPFDASSAVSGKSGDTSRFVFLSSYIFPIIFEMRNPLFHSI